LYYAPNRSPKPKAIESLLQVGHIFISDGPQTQHEGSGFERQQNSREGQRRSYIDRSRYRTRSVWLQNQTYGSGKGK